MVEIKSIKLTPFTLMSSSVQAILAFILGIITLIVFSIAGAVIPQFGATFALAGVTALIAFPILTFFVGLATHFFSAFLYNGLVPRLGGIKLELEGSEVTEIPAVSFALILAAIQAIWAFIVGLFLAASSAPVFSLLSSSPEVAQAITNMTNTINTTAATIPTPQAIGGAGITVALLLIIGLPIITFIVGFIVDALTAIFYNYIAVRAVKLKLEFEKVTDTLHELKTIPVVPAALSVAIIFTIWGIIQGIGNLIQLSTSGNPAAGVGSLIGNIIGNFIVYFIVVAIAAWLYNYLVPKIGGIELGLE